MSTQTQNILADIPLARVETLTVVHQLGTVTIHKDLGAIGGFLAKHADAEIEFSCGYWCSMRAVRGEYVAFLVKVKP